MSRPLDSVRTLWSGMSERRTNLALLGLTTAAIATGALNFAGGTRWVWYATIAHGVVALGILFVSHWKWRMIRRGVDVRPLSSTWPSLLLLLCVAVAVVTGVLHTSGLVLEYGPLGDIQIHVGAALLAVPLTVWHLVARGNLPNRRDLSRRNLLRTGLLLGGATALYGTLEGAYRTLGLPGADRRFTGSFEEASHDPPAMPSIIWLFDPRLDLAAEDWSMEVVDSQGTRRLSLDDLTTYDDRLTAVLDCTSGWYAEQDWHGVRLDRLLHPEDGARSLTVRSETGYWRRFPVSDIPTLLLATGYEGEPLAPRHGFPARLVAPGRRGFWWVKWVTQLEVTGAPAWRQPPYPLQ